MAAARWKTQINENAKVPAFASSLPELDHNEVVGWTGAVGERSSSWRSVTTGSTHELAARFPLSIDDRRAAGGEVEEVAARGASAARPAARRSSCIGDLASAYLAIGRGVDPTPIEVIERLKARARGVVTA